MSSKRYFPAVCFTACMAIGYAAAPVVVHQKALQFSETELTLTRGQVVVFKNDDRTSHNITVMGEGVTINGGLQPPGVDYSLPFLQAGSYLVTCGIHPKMQIVVTIK